MLNKNAKGLTRSDRPRMWSQNCSQVNNWHTVDIVQSLILVETSTKEFNKISAGGLCSQLIQQCCGRCQILGDQSLRLDCLSQFGENYTADFNLTCSVEPGGQWRFTSTQAAAIIQHQCQLSIALVLTESLASCICSSSTPRQLQHRSCSRCMGVIRI